MHGRPAAAASLLTALGLAGGLLAGVAGDGTAGYAGDGGNGRVRIVRS